MQILRRIYNCVSTACRNCGNKLPACQLVNGLCSKCR